MGDFDVKKLYSSPYILVRNGRIVEAGDQFLELTGYSRKHILNKDAKYFCHRILKLDKNVDVLAQGKKSAFIFTCRLAPREVNISTKLLPSENNSLIIFKEKPNSRLEKKFLYVEELCRANLIGVAIYSAPELVLVKANQKYLDLLEHPYNRAKKSIGLRLEKIASGWKGSPVEAPWREAIAAGKAVQVNEWRGSIRRYSIITPVRESGRIRYVVGNTFDVTGGPADAVSIKAHDQTGPRDGVSHPDTAEISGYNQVPEEKAELLKAAVENMEAAVLIFDRDGRYIFVNRACQRYITAKFEKMGDGCRAAKLYDLEGNSLSLKDTPGYHVKCGLTVRDRILLLKTDGREFYVSVSGTPVFDGSGNTLYGVLCFYDVTEFVKRELASLESQKRLLDAERTEKEGLKKSIKMKDEFLAVIAHEFKTPLTIINAAIQTLENLYGSQLSDSVRRYLQKIRSNSFRQLRLVNNLLDIIRYRSGHFKIQKRNLDIVFISRAITRSVEPYAAQKGLELSFASEVERLEMAVDEEKYERILLNLLSNAIKFTPKDKRISVALSFQQRKAVITVRDEGIGIPGDKLNMIFERFGQVDSALSRQAEGTGIGLSLVKTLVESLDGKIAVDSEMGLGSTFTVTLPVRKIRRKEQDTGSKALQDKSLILTAAIEFSDIYLY